MKLKELPNISRMMISEEDGQSVRDLTQTIELMEEYANRPDLEEFQQDFLTGIAYCRERIAEISHCQVCGAAR